MDGMDDPGSQEEPVINTDCQAFDFSRPEAQADTKSCDYWKHDALNDDVSAPWRVDGDGGLIHWLRHGAGSSLNVQDGSMQVNAAAVAERQMYQGKRVRNERNAQAASEAGKKHEARRKDIMMITADSLNALVGFSMLIGCVL